MFNLIEYSKNYRKTTGSLYNYYRDEPNSDAVGNYTIIPLKIQSLLSIKQVLLEN